MKSKNKQMCGHREIREIVNDNDVQRRERLDRHDRDRGEKGHSFLEA